jgi:CBS-domain-containing membrane protein
MSNKKTAMQELIYWLKSGWKDEDIDTVIKKSKELLEIEKEQIRSAYVSGFDDGEYLKTYLDLEYYNETYKQ